MTPTLSELYARAIPQEAKDVIRHLFIRIEKLSKDNAELKNRNKILITWNEENKKEIAKLKESLRNRNAILSPAFDNLGEELLSNCASGAGLHLRENFGSASPEGPDEGG